MSAMTTKEKIAVLEAGQRWRMSTLLTKGLDPDKAALYREQAEATRAGAVALRKLDGADALHWPMADFEESVSNIIEHATDLFSRDDGILEYRTALLLGSHENRYAAWIATTCDDAGDPVEGGWQVFFDHDIAKARQAAALDEARKKGGAA